MIEITLLNGDIKQFPDGTSSLDVAKSISYGLGENVLSASFNGKIVEAAEALPGNGSLVLHTWEDSRGKQAFWHSSAHVLAQTLQQFYPNIKLAIGPPIEKGFYYDVDLGSEIISKTDFPEIEKRMLENARAKSEFKMRKVSKASALASYKNNEYKTELIQNLEDGSITFCNHANFTDLCRGGHIPNTAFIKSVKIMNIAGVYWRGNENNPQLTRIYGVSFPRVSMLENYLQLLEEAKKQDHRKLGKELGLFTFSKKVGQGLPLWLPKGAALRELLENFLKKVQKKAGYEQVISSHIGSKELYMTSGHYTKYDKHSFRPITTPEGGEEYLLKPMNCPNHCEIFNSQPHSYRDLPIRFAEFATVYRYEQSGELHGLIRARGFTQDDAHLFCMLKQLKDEFKTIIDLVLYVLKTLNFESFTAQISLRDKEDHSKYIGSEKNWEKAEEAIIKASVEKELKTVIKYGEAAFYGPKLDFMIKDALGRQWQLGTIQVDYNLPERFELEYKGADNEMHRPVMIHRTLLGSMERFIALLLEHCGGSFPLWLAPEQAVILPISEKYAEYAQRVSNSLKNCKLRTLIDERAEKTSRKIRDAEIAKIPYMLIIGRKEEKANTISVRRHAKGDLGTMEVEEFAQMVNREIEQIEEFN